MSAALKPVQEIAAPEEALPENILEGAATLSPGFAFSTGMIDKILAGITEKVNAEPVDITTVRGREALKSLCYKVTRSKTALDGMGKGLTEQWRLQTGAVNEQRRKLRDDLDALIARKRKPLTDWEAAEEKRLDGHRMAISTIDNLGNNHGVESSVEDIDAALETLALLRDRDWQEFRDMAADKLEGAQEGLARLRTQVVQREADRAELARLREMEAARQREEAARRQVERDAEIAAQAAAEATRQAAAAVKAAEQAAAWEREAADERAKAAEQKLLEQQQKAAREQEEAVAAERRRAEQAAAAEKAEADRRAADLAHRGGINRQILAALAGFGIEEPQGRLLITAMATGKLPHVKIHY